MAAMSAKVRKRATGLSQNMLLVKKRATVLHQNTLLGCWEGEWFGGGEQIAVKVWEVLWEEGGEEELEQEGK